MDTQNNVNKHRGAVRLPWSRQGQRADGKDGPVQSVGGIVLTHFCKRTIRMHFSVSLT